MQRASVVLCIYKTILIFYDITVALPIERDIDDQVEGNRFQVDWDFMFSTDTEYLSDGYRVNIVQFLFTDGTEEICELVVGPANIGNG